MNVIDVSIIIVSYNSKELILDCIQSIIDHTKAINYEIIVVDNASSDGSINAIKKSYPNVIVIESDINLGFGRANNIGVKKARGDYLFFLNPDTIITENSIYLLYDFYRKNSRFLKIGVLGCKLIDKEMNLGNACGNFPKIQKDITDSILKILNKIFSTNISSYKKYIFEQDFFEVDMVSGADMFIEKKVFENVGGFDENFFMYYEETDLQKRIRKIGLHNFIYNKTSIIHLEGGGIKKNDIKKRIMIEESKNYYFRKHDKFLYPIYFILECIINIGRLLNKKYTLNENLHFLKSSIKSMIR